MSGASKPRVWTVWLAYFVLIVAVMVSSTAALIIVSIHNGLNDVHLEAKDALSNIMQSPIYMTCSVGLFSVSTLVIAFCAARLGATTWKERLKLSGGNFRWRSAGVVLLGTVGIGTMMESTAVLLGLLEGSSLLAFVTVVKNASFGTFLLLFVFGSLFAGLAEEVFFRGYMQSRLEQRWNAWAAILLTSVCFGLLHADRVHSPIAFALGLWLGWSAHRTGDIRASVVAHILNNAVSFWMIRLLPSQPLSVHAWCLLAGGIACVVAVYGMLRLHPPKPVELPTAAVPLAG